MSSTVAQIDPLGNRLGLYGKDVGRPIDPLGNALEDAMTPKTPSMPAAPPPLAPATIEDAQAAGAQASDALRRRQGRASTILSGTSSGAGNVQTATKALLGS